MRHNFRILFIIVLLYSISLACASASPALIQVEDTPQPLNSIIALTYSSALTQTAAVSGAQLQHVELTTTPDQTETPAFPKTYIYEGTSQSCVCTKCVCISNIIIDANVIIDSQGHVSGTLTKYLDKMPSMKFDGTKDNLYGVLKIGRDEANDILQETDEFSGRLSANYATLEFTLSAAGTYLVNSRFTFSGQQFTAKRTFILFKK
jgi:hypothetical protein